MFYKKEKIFLMTRIIITILFLTFSSYIWFNLKDFTVYKTNTRENIIVSENITFSSLKQVSDNDVLKIEEYNFQIENKAVNNQNIKIIIVQDVIQNNISNNYLKYIINDGEIHSLNREGIVYIDNKKK